MFRAAHVLWASKYYQSDFNESDNFVIAADAAVSRIVKLLPDLRIEDPLRDSVLSVEIALKSAKRVLNDDEGIHRHFYDAVFAHFNVMDSRVYSIRPPLYDALVYDIEWMCGAEARGNEILALTSQPLWLFDTTDAVPNVLNLPDWLFDCWEHIENEFNSPDRFGHWIDWYVALLAANKNLRPWDFFGESLLLNVATQENEWWDRPEREVNADIRRWLEKPEFGHPVATVNRAITDTKGPLTVQLDEGRTKLSRFERSLSEFDGRIGHNNPPEPIEDIQQISQMREEIRNLQRMVQSNNFSRQDILVSQSVLRKFGKWLTDRFTVAIDTTLRLGIVTLFAHWFGVWEFVSNLIMKLL